MAKFEEVTLKEEFDIRGGLIDDKEGGGGPPQGGAYGGAGGGGGVGRNMLELGLEYHKSPDRSQDPDNIRVPTRSPGRRGDTL